MTRVTSILLFFFLALQLNYLVYGTEDIKHRFTYSTGKIYNSFGFATSKKDGIYIHKCRFIHNGMEEITEEIDYEISKDYTIERFGETEGVTWGKSRESDNCYVWSNKAHPHNYGRYEITAFSPNNTILFTEVFDLHKTSPVMIKKRENIHYTNTGMISLNASEILGMCKLEENKGLCPNDTFMINSMLTCYLSQYDYNSENGKKYYHTLEYGVVKNATEEKGNCHSEIYDSYNNKGIWNLEAWYGGLTVIKNFKIKKDHNSAGNHQEQNDSNTVRDGQHESAKNQKQNDSNSANDGQHDSLLAADSSIASFASHYTILYYLTPLLQSLVNMQFK